MDVFLASAALSLTVWLTARAFLGVPLLPARRKKGAVPDPNKLTRKEWLHQAGTDLSVAKFYGGSAVFAATTFVLLILVTGVPAAAIVPALVVAAAPTLHFSKQREKRLSAAQEAWPDVLSELVSVLRSNTTLVTALASVSSSGPPVMQEAFKGFSAQARMNGVPKALEQARERLADATSDRVIEVLIIADERGADSAPPLLEDIAEATRQDLRIRQQISTNQREMRWNGRAVFALPWVILVLLTMSDSGMYHDFYRSFPGYVVMFFGALLSILGMWVFNKLGKVPGEPRSFVSTAAAKRRPPPAAPGTDEGKAAHSVQ